MLEEGGREGGKEGTCTYEIGDASKTPPIPPSPPLPSLLFVILAVERELFRELFFRTFFFI